MQAKTLRVSVGAIFFLLALALLPQFIGPDPAMAVSSYLTSFNALYPNSTTGTTAWSTTGNRCNVCHSSGGGTDLNAYGAAWTIRHNAGRTPTQAYQDIEGLNSDGSAANDIGEINANAQPGWRSGPNNTLYDMFDPTLVTATGQNPPTTLTGVVDPVATNNAPVLAPIGAKSVNEGQPLTFTATATDPDGNAFTFTATFSGGNLPTGATLTPAGVFNWTPTFAQAGNYDVTITVTDNGSPAQSDFEIVTITVGNVNRPPVLAPIGNKSVNENQALAFTATATDPDGNAFTFSGGSLPTGATLTPAGVFNWTPTFAQAGNYDVTITVTDNGSPAQNDFEIVTITVVDGTTVNRPPVLAPIGNKSVNENQALAFTATATDPDGNAFTFTATFSGGNLPTGATLTPAGVFNWTPTFAQAGNYNVTITVTDNGSPAASDFEIVTITVGNVNRPPVLSPSPIGTRTVTEGQTLTIAITASDPDGGALTFTSANLPTGATLTPATPAGTGAATFSWTPATGQAGSYPNVTITVSDGALTDAEVFTITVQTSTSTPTPVCTMAVSPTALAFGSVNLGSSKTMTTTIRNTGTANCTVSSLTVSGAGFALGSAAPSVGATIAPNATRSVPVDFTPTAAGAATGSLFIGTMQVSLSGTGVPVTPPTGGTGGAVDLNIVRFRATDEVELGEGKSVRFQLVVKNVSKVTGSAPATLVGMRNGVEVYRQALDVSAPAGKMATFAFPPYTPTAAGKIKWTVTIQDQGPARRNTATAITEVEREEQKETEHSDHKRS